MKSLNPIQRFPDGTILRVAVEEWLPHIRVDQAPNGAVFASGPMASLLEALSSNLNFNYTLHRPHDALWGAPDSQGNWNGMIGMLKRNETDLALGPFIISERRASAVDFSTIILIDYFRLMFARELPKSDPYSFLRTFAPSVWVGIGICLILTIIPVFLSRYYIEESRYSVTETAEKTFFDIIGLFLQQDGKLSQVLSIRIVLCCVFILNLIIMKNFSSTLTSLLAVKVSPIKFRYIQQLIHDSSYTMVLEASTAITAALKASESGLFGDMNAKLKRNQVREVKIGDLPDFTETKIKNGKMGLFVEEITCLKYMSDFFSNSGVCEYYLAEEKLLPSMFGIIAQKKSPLLTIINPVMQRIVEANLYEQWLKNLMPNATKCLDKASFRQFSMQPYTVRGLWVMFALLAYGLILASFVFLCEMWSHWRKSFSQSARQIYTSQLKQKPLFKRTHRVRRF